MSSKADRRYKWGWPEPHGWVWLGSTDDEDEAYRAMQRPNVEAYDTVERRWLAPEPECTCDPAPEAEPNPRCPYHGKEGTMVGTVFSTSMKPVCLPCWRTNPDARGGMEAEPPRYPQRSELTRCALCGRPTTAGIWLSLPFVSSLPAPRF